MAIVRRVHIYLLLVRVVGKYLCCARPALAGRRVLRTHSTRPGGSGNGGDLQTLWRSPPFRAGPVARRALGTVPRSLPRRRSPVKGQTGPECGASRAANRGMGAPASVAAVIVVTTTLLRLYLGFWVLASLAVARGCRLSEIMPGPSCRLKVTEPPLVSAACFVAIPPPARTSHGGTSAGPVAGSKMASRERISGQPAYCGLGETSWPPLGVGSRRRHIRLWPGVGPATFATGPFHGGRSSHDGLRETVRLPGPGG